jgi:hypothetical protein
MLRLILLPGTKIFVKWAIEGRKYEIGSFALNKSSGKSKLIKILPFVEEKEWLIRTWL